MDPCCLSVVIHIVEDNFQGGCTIFFLTPVKTCGVSMCSSNHIQIVFNPSWCFVVWFSQGIVGHRGEVGGVAELVGSGGLG